MEHMLLRSSWRLIRLGKDREIPPEPKVFTTTTITSIPGLAALLAVALSASSPKTESELSAIYASFYAAKLNAALEIFQFVRRIGSKGGG